MKGPMKREPHIYLHFRLMFKPRFQWIHVYFCAILLPVHIIIVYSRWICNNVHINYYSFDLWRFFCCFIWLEPFARIFRIKNIHEIWWNPCKRKEINDSITMFTCLRWHSCHFKNKQKISSYFRKIFCFWSHVKRHKSAIISDSVHSNGIR